MLLWPLFKTFILGTITRCYWSGLSASLMLWNELPYKALFHTCQPTHQVPLDPFSMMAEYILCSFAANTDSSSWSSGLLPLHSQAKKSCGRWNPSHPHLLFPETRHKTLPENLQKPSFESGVCLQRGTILQYVRQLLYHFQLLNRLWIFSPFHYLFMLLEGRGQEEGRPSRKPNLDQ